MFHIPFEKRGKDGYSRNHSNLFIKRKTRNIKLQVFFYKPHYE
ncbi:hypothetical protein FM120_28505 [Sphingobacterium faecium PCAi_F2.5]|nr:hypothetical protein FM120_28505 [Sphingobacterium faecium PCAi_F2.5]